MLLLQVIEYFSCFSLADVTFFVIKTNTDLENFHGVNYTADKRKSEEHGSTNDANGREKGLKDGELKKRNCKL